MENKLKNLNFEDKIPTVFTEKNRQETLIKIQRIEKKSNKKQSIIPIFLTVSVVSILFFLGFNSISDNFNASKGNAGKGIDESIKHQKEKEKERHLQKNEEEVEKLRTGVNFFWHDPTEYHSYSDSNYNLYVAHLRSAMITGHGVKFDNVTPKEDNKYKEYLRSILTYLNKIEPNGEKEDELQKAVQLTTQAINNNVPLGDPILDQINTILRELDNYFNLNPFVEDKTTEHGIKIFE